MPAPDPTGGFAPVPDAGGFQPVETASGGGLLQTAWDTHQRVTDSVTGSLMRGTADLIDTMISPGASKDAPAWQKWLFQKDFLDPSLESARDWFNKNAPQPPEAKGVVEGAENVVSGVVGGAAPGIAEWMLGTPFAALHGVKTAEDYAEEHHRHATPGEMAFDAMVEAAGRKFMGVVSAKGIGRVPTALTFGGVAGAEDIAEKKADPKTAALDVGINMVMGFLGPNLSHQDQIRVRAALDAATHGDSKGAMNHLNPVLLAHSDQIAAAARNLGVDAAVEAYAPKGERTETPRRPGEARRRAKSTLATQITHRERNDAVARARMSGWEAKFAGIPDEHRMQLITAYQRGGLPGVKEAQEHLGYTEPEQDFRAFFKDFAGILSDQASSEHAAGIEYELRQEYAPGYWQDPERAKAFYTSTPSAGDPLGAKPSFTKGKGFEDYQEGIEAGFRPKSTNPAVLAAMRVEAGNRAIMRRASMRDLVSDGLAIPLEEETRAGAARAKAKKVQITKDAVQEMLQSGEARGVKELNADRKMEGLPPVRGNLKHGGSEYAVNGDAIARLRDRQQRITSTRMRPREHRDWRMLDVGGTRYLVHPDAESVTNHALGMDKFQQFTDLLGIGRDTLPAKAERGVYSAWMGFRNVTIPAILSLSGFHALHVMNIDMAQPITAAVTPALNLHMTPEGFAKAVIDGWDSAGRAETGRRASENFSRTDKDLSPTERLEQNLMLAGGFSPQMPSVYETRAVEIGQRALNDAIPSIMQEAERSGWDWGLAVGLSKEAAELATTQVGHITERLNGPLFKTFIPQMKASAYINEAKALLGSRPDLLEGTPEANAQLREELRNISNSIDNRFGMMQYDKLFWPALARRSLFGTFLSVGWNYGFLREFGQGLFVDVPKTVTNLARGRGLEISTRTVYASTYLALATMISGMMTYLFTGTPPSEPKDFIYPRLPDGTRLNTMFFSREFGAAYYHLSQEGVQKGTADLIEGKLAPTGQKAMEVLHNEDYFGNQVYDPNARFWDQVKEALSHEATGMVEPISLQGAFAHPGESASMWGLGFAGFNPAPKYIDRSPTQARILRAYDETHPQHVVPYAEVQRTQDLQKVKQLYQQSLKSGQDADKTAWRAALDDYIKKYPDHVGRGTIRRSIKSWTEPEYAYQFQMLDPSTQTALLHKMSPAERKTYLPYANAHIRALQPHLPDPTGGFEADDKASPAPAGFSHEPAAFTPDNQMQDFLSEQVGAPVHISSSYRNPLHNAEVGGASGSAHTRGEAWDFESPGIPFHELARRLITSLTTKGISWDQVEVAHNHVHVSFDPRNRGEVIDEAGRPMNLGQRQFAAADTGGFEPVQ